MLEKFSCALTPPSFPSCDPGILLLDADVAGASNDGSEITTLQPTAATLALPGDVALFGRRMSQRGGHGHSPWLMASNFSGSSPEFLLPLACKLLGCCHFLSLTSRRVSNHRSLLHPSPQSSSKNLTLPLNSQQCKTLNTMKTYPLELLDKCCVCQKLKAV